MKKKIHYSFDDEPIIKFSYSFKEKKIEIFFNRFYDLQKNKFVEAPCVFTIEKWMNAYSLLPNSDRKYKLDMNMGVFSLLLYMKFNDENLEMFVNTIDNRYVIFQFESALYELSLL